MFIIALVRLVPVLTSVWILRVPAAYSALPAAPPTASRDSTSGTPAANIVDSVRVQRAIVAFSMIAPITGTLRMMRSKPRRNATDRLNRNDTPTTVPIRMMNIAHQ